MTFNWAALAAIGSLIGVLVTLFSVAFLAGGFKKEIETHETRLDGHDERLERQDKKLGDHSIKIALLERWHEGFSAAANSRSKEPSDG